jgi:hypothetical protein
VWLLICHWLNIRKEGVLGGKRRNERNRDRNLAQARPLMSNRGEKTE